MVADTEMAENTGTEIDLNINMLKDLKENMNMRTSMEIIYKNQMELVDLKTVIP